jgi:hypothetical protein
MMCYRPFLMLINDNKKESKRIHPLTVYAEN